MNNSVYEKTMENLRHMVDVTLVSNNKDYQKLMSNPCFASQNIFNVIHKIKEKVTLKKLAYVGMCRLD